MNEALYRSEANRTELVGKWSVARRSAAERKFTMDTLFSLRSHVVSTTLFRDKSSLYGRCFAINRRYNDAVHAVIVVGVAEMVRFKDGFMFMASKREIKLDTAKNEIQNVKALLCFFSDLNRTMLAKVTFFRIKSNVFFCNLYWDRPFNYREILLGLLLNRLKLCKGFSAFIEACTFHSWCKPGS